VGAEKDHTVPASLARKQYEKYERSPATTEYVEFEGRPHLLMAAEGWEEWPPRSTAGSTGCSKRGIDGLTLPRRRPETILERPPQRRRRRTPDPGQPPGRDRGCTAGFLWTHAESRVTN
jgi:hypothetical protein